ncbi:helix-turn-helix transcriptional regulator [Alistipes communis]|uniref:helix-turn-helix transcriptional regulator n=1 Tax=Alistipes communis TaxID=2585118 RepID=UPI003A848DAA
MDRASMIHAEPYLNSFIPEYNHKSGMFLCMSGTAEVLINNSVYRLEKGVLYVVSPLVTIHRISQSADFDGIHILDDWEVFYPVIHTIIDTILQLKLRNSPCLRLNETEVDFLISRNDLIEGKRREMENASIAEEKNLILRMIQLLEQETMLEIIRVYFRNKTVESHPMDKKESIVYNFIYSLHFNFKQQRSVTFYADEARLSTGYFTAVVREKTGRTPSEWIIDITITQAKLLLEKTKKSIKEIAAELNFPEQFTFRKYFKQHTGIAPKEYRLNCNKVSVQ